MPSKKPHRKIALIIGAGSGIGRETALQLALAGYHLVLVARTRSKLDATAKLIKKQTSPSLEIITLAADVTSPASCKKIVATTLARFRRIDALVNSAGYAPLLPIPRTTPRLWRQIIDTNLSSIVHLTAAAWPTFRKQKSGVIVNVSSMAGSDPFPGFALYAAAKSGLNMFTRATASEGKIFNIRAVAIAPGCVETPMLRANFSKKNFPTSKTLSPVQVASVIRDCVTGDRPFANGETIWLPSP